MFGFLKNGSSASCLPADLRGELDADDVILIAERVGVVTHLRGHVPGVFSSSSAARSRGAFALTASRVVATFSTGADPHLRAIDSGWDLPTGPARVSIGSKGLLIDVALRGIDAAFSGSMTLTYKRTIPGDVLARLPAAQLRCSMDPAFVYRAAGVRPRGRADR